MSARIKINLHEGVIEIEGSEDFVDRQLSKIEEIIELFNQTNERNSFEQNQDDTFIDDSENLTNTSTTQNINQTKELNVPDNFGEWMHKFKEDISDQQKALVAAYYVQARSPTNDFKTIEINNCLKEHGIKIANPSTSIKRLSTKKLTFQTRKIGKLIFMRVSKDGEAHLKAILRS